MYSFDKGSQTFIMLCATYGAKVHMSGRSSARHFCTLKGKSSIILQNETFEISKISRNWPSLEE